MSGFCRDNLKLTTNVHNLITRESIIAMTSRSRVSPHIIRLVVGNKRDHRTTIQYTILDIKLENRSRPQLSQLDDFYFSKNFQKKCCLSFFLSLQIYYILDSSGKDVKTKLLLLSWCEQSSSSDISGCFYYVDWSCHNSKCSLQT